MHKLAGHEASIHAVTTSPDGTLIASGDDDGEVRVWDPEAGKSLYTFKKAHRGKALDVAITRDNSCLATSGADGVVHLWDLRTGKHVRALEPDIGSLAVLRWIGEDSMLVVGGKEKIAFLDPEGKRETEYLTVHEGKVWGMDLHRESGLLATSSTDGKVHVWSLARRERVASFEGHEGWVFNVAFRPDGRQLASVGQDGTLRLWPIERKAATKDTE